MDIFLLSHKVSSMCMMNNWPEVLLTTSFHKKNMNTTHSRASPVQQVSGSISASDLRESFNWSTIMQDMVGKCFLIHSHVLSDSVAVEDGQDKAIPCLPTDGGFRPSLDSERHYIPFS